MIGRWDKWDTHRRPLLTQNRQSMECLGQEAEVNGKVAKGPVTKIHVQDTKENIVKLKQYKMWKRSEKFKTFCKCNEVNGSLVPWVGLISCYYSLPFSEDAVFKHSYPLQGHLLGIKITKTLENKKIVTNHTLSPSIRYKGHTGLKCPLARAMHKSLLPRFYQKRMQNKLSLKKKVWRSWDPPLPQSIKSLAFATS